MSEKPKTELRDCWQNVRLTPAEKDRLAELARQQKRSAGDILRDGLRAALTESKSDTPNGGTH